MAKPSALQMFIALGFDLTKNIPFTKLYSIRCSMCQNLIINGVPCHELGCPNQKYECIDCDAIVPRKGMYCQDCT